MKRSMAPLVEVKTFNGGKATTLGAEIDLLVGFAFKSAKYSDSEDAIRLLRGDNIVQGCLRWDDVKRWPAHDTASYERYQLRDGDVVLAMDRPWVKAGLKHATISADDLPCLLVQRTASLRAGANLDRRFLMYLIGSDEFTRHIVGLQTGIGVPHISGQQIKDFAFIRPPVPEQRRIVGILDEAFEGIATAKANAEKNLQNARELFESHLQSVFTQRGNGWVEKRIPDICLTFGRGKSRHRPRNEPSLYGGDYPFIQTGDLSNANHVVITYSQTYNDKGLAQSKLWPKGTVGIAIVGATIGESAVLGFDACFPDSVIGMTVNPTFADPFFLEYMLQHFKDHVKARGEGSARENINIGTFDNFLFPIPPVSDQKRLVECFDRFAEETQNLAILYQRKLAAIEELKKSLLDQAFSGKL